MPPPSKRRKTHGVEEVKFDDSSRYEYLTGFRKRKQQRIKHAQEVAAKLEREQKIAQRKQLKEQRKKELEDHVKAVNDALQGEDEHSESEGESKIRDSSNGFLAEKVFNEVMEDGLPEEREDEYVDEDRRTTVTIEPMDMSGDGSPSFNASDDSEAEANGKDVEKAKRMAKGGGAASKEAGVREGSERQKKKKKRKKFRYETKSERKVSRAKQKLKKGAAARARRAAVDG